MKIGKFNVIWGVCEIERPLLTCNCAPEANESSFEEKVVAFRGISSLPQDIRTP